MEGGLHVCDIQDVKNHDTSIEPKLTCIMFGQGGEFEPLSTI